METIYDLFVEQLKDVYSAELQLTKALPKMVKNATTPALQKAFTDHLSETETQVQRLQAIAAELGEKLTGKKCQAMEGLVEEVVTALKESGHPSVKDAGIVAAAQRVEHYEIAAYGTLVMLAEKLGFSKTARVLQKSLVEESNADEKLLGLLQKQVLPKCPVTEESELSANA